MPASRRAREDRVFVKDGRRHHRRRYSATEFRIGLAVLALLAIFTAWIAWKGAHPDPELLGSNADLLVESAPAADRGILPAGLALPGWREGAVSQFGYDNLYEKIDGREDYYKSFGFERLYYVSLYNEENPGAAVDIEVYDLGEPPNALGALAGERPEGAVADVGQGGIAYLHRNALLMTRGRYYARVIGSDESAETVLQLRHLKRMFEEGVAGPAIPLEYALFVGGLGVDPGRISFTAENAFSFGFANDVYSALLDDGETEVFVTAAASEGDAGQLAARFTEGFLGYGSAVEEQDRVHWVKDRYIGSVSGAVRFESSVIGVRGAPDLAVAKDAFRRLEDALKAIDASERTP